jgi:hypothetical protein
LELSFVSQLNSHFSTLFNSRFINNNNNYHHHKRHQPYEKALEYYNLGNSKMSLKSMQSLLEAKAVSKVVLDAMVESNLVDAAALEEFFDHALPKQVKKKKKKESGGG